MSLEVKKVAKNLHEEMVLLKKIEAAVVNFKTVRSSNRRSSVYLEPKYIRKINDDLKAIKEEYEKSLGKLVGDSI